MTSGENDDSQKDVMKMLPVSSLYSNNVYRNIYCAQCNNDSFKIYVWGVSMSCNSGPPPGTKEDRFLLLSTKEGQEKTGCTMEFQKPYHATNRDCSRQPSLISSCNVTGSWKYYDADIQKACAAYESVFYTEYKNIFCYICNVEDNITINDLKSWKRNGPNINNILPPDSRTFEVLLTFNDYRPTTYSVLQQQTSCPPFKVYVKATGKCQDMLCSEGKSLTSLGECRSRNTFNMVGYQVCVLFDVSTVRAIKAIDVESLLEWNHFSSIPSILELVLALNYWCPNSTCMSVHWQARISREGLPEDLEQEVENAIDKYKQHLEQYFRSLGTNVTYFNYTFLDICPNVSSIEHTCQLDRKITEPKRNSKTYFILEKESYIKNNVSNFTELTECSFIELPRNLFRDKGESVVEFTPTKKDMSSNKFYIVNETVVRICVSDYINLTSADLNITNQWNNQTLKLLHDISTTGGLISVICTGISLTCLLLTFITYLLLPTLRSASGKNIMVLILTLFLAQTFYQFTLEHSEEQTTCLVFGVLIHYTWLAALFSMNVCTIERFYMLCFPLKSRAFFLSKRPFILGTAYTLLAPLAVCVVNMVANYVTRGQLGYGGDYVCFITSKVSRIASFAVPVAIIVLVNISLMTFTACKLRRGSSTQLQSSVQSKLGLVAMVRLSVVTGLMWLLAFLYDVSNNKYVDYVITALIGLHGVVLFYSLVINKRVAQLFSDLCRTRQTSSSRSKEESSTTQPIMGGRKHVHEPTLSASSGISTISTDGNRGKISSITSESNV